MKFIQCDDDNNTYLDVSQIVRLEKRKDIIRIYERIITNMSVDHNSFELHYFGRAGFCESDLKLIMGYMGNGKG